MRNVITALLAVMLITASFGFAGVEAGEVELFFKQVITFEQPGIVTTITDDGTVVIVSPDVVLFYRWIAGNAKLVRNVAGDFSDAKGIATGDFDNDGTVDVAVAIGKESPNGKVILVRAETMTTLAGPNRPSSITSLDIGNDGQMDLAVSHYYSGGGIWFYRFEDGNVNTSSVFAPHSSDWNEIVTADFNQDGLDDFVFMSKQPPLGRIDLDNIWVYQQNPDGAFAQCYSRTGGDRFNVMGMAVGDFNADGWPDVAATNPWISPFSSHIAVWLNQGGTLAVKPALLNGTWQSEILAAGNFDGEGADELVYYSTMDQGDMSIAVSDLYHPAGPVERHLKIFPGEMLPQSIVCGDVDGDGKDDCVLAGSQRTYLLLTTLPPGHGAISTSISPAVILPYLSLTDSTRITFVRRTADDTLRIQVSVMADSVWGGVIRVPCLNSVDISWKNIGGFYSTGFVQDDTLRVGFSGPMRKAIGQLGELQLVFPGEVDEKEYQLDIWTDFFINLDGDKHAVYSQVSILVKYDIELFLIPPVAVVPGNIEVRITGGLNPRLADVLPAPVQLDEVGDKLLLAADLRYWPNGQTSFTFAFSIIDNRGSRRTKQGEFQARLGDVSPDGNITVADVLKTLEVMAGKRVLPYQLVVADYNQDGTVDIRDVMAILWFILVGPSGGAAKSLPLPPTAIETVRERALIIRGEILAGDAPQADQALALRALEDVLEQYGITYRLNQNYQNYPNPFNPETTISYDVAKAGMVRLTIYTLTGQRIRTLVDEERPAGTYSVIWNGTDDGDGEVASGVYLYRLEAAGFTSTRRMVLVR